MDYHTNGLSYRWIIIQNELSYKMNYHTNVNNKVWSILNKYDYLFYIELKKFNDV